MDYDDGFPSGSGAETDKRHFPAARAGDLHTGNRWDISNRWDRRQFLAARVGGLHISKGWSVIPWLSPVEAYTAAT
eukprot:510983-Pelagomonas_calceolata.AAC.1